MRMAVKGFGHQTNVRCIMCTFLSFETMSKSVVRIFGTKSGTRTKKFSQTVILPKTKFPIHLDSKKRVDLDALLFDKCKFATLYNWQRTHVTGPEFILHDGPPYANGPVHMGHAINKILKDITLRHKLLSGYKVHYIPGWDCHGLPIELKVQTEKDISLSPIKIRQNARQLAKEAITQQQTAFRSWGIMANWDKCYFTHDTEYTNNQWRIFLKMYETGFIYRALKPVYWSPSSRTALAEAELEYNPLHKSTAVTIRFPIRSLPEQLLNFVGENMVYALIWTTTPWTLPANQAVCFNPNMLYSIGRFGDENDERYLFATDQVNMIEEKLKREVMIEMSFPGSALEGCTYMHPLATSQELPFLPANYVTKGIGTGLVHMAPAHGPEDFLTALDHQLPVQSLVDDTGCYTEAVGPDLHGLFVLTSGNTKVMEILERNILKSEAYVHSYPYDWRTKQPIILRASHQWFIDTSNIKSKAIKQLENVSVFQSGSAGYTHVLEQQVDKRPYWCISRQRVWGVPIPVLYDSRNQKPLISKDFIDHLCSLLDHHGSDFWWTLPLEALAPKSLLVENNIDLSHVERGEDILDIWFDSGVSWANVLGMDKIADLCLEGVDQYNGWFQSSLLTSVALRGVCPYKSLFVHGFAVDERGLKMSKSVGNVVDPQEIVFGNKKKGWPAHGVDTLRWWVASHATQHSNVIVSPNIIQASADAVQKIRLVLRFLLGALHDLTDERESPVEFYNLDLYLLHLLWKFDGQVKEMYENYQYHHVCKTVTKLVTNEVSALYCHVIKDRLYCEAKDSPTRRACQIVLKRILETVTGAIGPILPYLAEEVYMHHPCKGDKDLFFHSSWSNALPEWNRPHVAKDMSLALDIRDVVNKTSPVKNTWELDAVLYTSAELPALIKSLPTRAELCEILQVSSVQVEEMADLPSGQFQVQLLPARKHLCARCRHYTADAEEQLCERCEKVVNSIPTD